MNCKNDIHRFSQEKKEANLEDEEMRKTSFCEIISLSYIMIQKVMDIE